MFQAYFTECLDIGRLDVIVEVARKSGLDEGQTINAINDGRYYAERLDKAKSEGQSIGLTGIPLFIIEQKYKIVGAQPIGNSVNFLVELSNPGTF